MKKQPKLNETKKEQINRHKSGMRWRLKRKTAKDKYKDKYFTEQNLLK